MPFIVLTSGEGVICHGRNLFITQIKITDHESIKCQDQSAGETPGSPKCYMGAADSLGVSQAHSLAQRTNLQGRQKTRPQSIQR